MEWLATFGMDYGLFLAKTLTLVVAIALIITLLVSSLVSLRRDKQQRLSIERVNDQLERMADTLADTLLGKAEKKARDKRRRKQRKARDKAAGDQNDEDRRPRLFVLDFDGDVRASAVDNLRESITALLQMAQAGDEVLLRLESAGGMVHSYGLAASQLTRLKAADIRLTVAVDRVAASGGYMMACVGDRIVAAPFAIIGSIGVVAQVPNLHRWLTDRQIDYEMHTAGDYKRTLTMFGENTDQGRQKFREELEETHELFKAFVAEQRPSLDVESVATGEHWYGTHALDRQLVDAITTSDDQMLAAARDKRDVYRVSFQMPQGALARLSNQASLALTRLLRDRELSRARVHHSHH